MTKPICLEAFRARRLAQLAPSTPVRPLHLSAAPDRVLLLFSNGQELSETPASGRVWAERILAMCDVAEALGRDERALLGAPDDGGAA